ncbi:glycosyltransferase family 4 protein [Pseudohoeflea coraliihabitans]|uniref:Glycosyltransferase family 4 protein n=1 Tax=Pseudohoeflea coraliihabitans TaxID=2860393 RepID=A0ABS6WNA1_9HYPH|nr:glycosyltransferase family 4 protein [Pseudohoeflea sp. DP4N28-3]MBW3097265.1 glycosyltransferase family 4 protein [Pseudohoeflea sp. DP4N28-3]
MKILVVTQYFWPETFKINELVAHLVGQGHTVTVLTGPPNYPGGGIFAEFRENPDRFARYEGAEVLRVPLVARGNRGLTLMANYLSFALTGSLLGPWKLRGRKQDAILVFAPSPSTVGLPALAARLFLGGRVIYWLQDLWPESLRAVGALRPGPTLSMLNAVSRFIYRRCDLLLAPARSLCRQLATEFGSSVRVEYLPNWVDKAADDDVVAQPAAGPPKDPSIFDIVYAGNIGDAQDLPALLDAAEALRDEPVRWLVAGTGRRAAWLEEAIRNRDLTAQVRLIGVYPRDQMPAIFRRADALIVSLKRDPVFAATVPTRLQSYLAAGRPILGMIDGEAADIIERSGAGLACPAGNWQRLAHNVRSLMSMDADVRDAMGARGQAFARQEFDRSTQLARLDAWLSETNSPASREQERGQDRSFTR